MSEDIIQIEQQIDSLLSDEQYARLTQIAPEFDLFEFLSSLSEDASSLALSFLLDSSREHGLGTAFFESFVENVHREGRDSQFRLTLRQSLNLQGDSTSVTTEWVTHEGRRLDLLIRVYDSARRLKAVAGIENKHWAIEQPEQVSHYQDALIKRFPRVEERVVFFLSPGARPSSTADPDCECPHVPCSYRAVTTALSEIENLTTAEIHLFVASLRNHFDKNLEGSHAMSSQIRELVHSLYRNPKHRNAIQHILEHLPRLGALIDDIQVAVESHLTAAFPGELFHFETYPKRQPERLQEFYVTPSQIEERIGKSEGFYFIYVLHPDRTKDAADVPDLGDYVTVQLLAWCEKSAYRDAVDKLNLPKKLPPSVGTPHSWYSQWREIWAGESHKLVDLGPVDTKACAKLFIDAIDATFPKLQSFIDSKFPEKS